MGGRSHGGLSIGLWEMRYDDTSHPYVRFSLYKRECENNRMRMLKYWQMWGPWQIGQLSATDYAKKAFQWAKALKLLDPSIELILCGETGHSSWDFEVLKTCIPRIDMHSIHIYTCASEHLPNVTAPLSAERAIQTAAAMIDVARIENNISPTKPRVCHISLPLCYKMNPVQIKEDKE
jgi:hypothetical protein